MRRNRSKFRHPRFENLYRLPGQPCWIYRKYFSEKRKEFYCSTGLDATEANAPAAYRAGVAKFNEWMGAFTPTDGTALIRDLGKIVLATKDDPQISDATRRAVANQINRHIIPACGHMKPGQITTEWWKNYQREERKKPWVATFRDGSTKEMPPRTAFFNTRKALVEVLGLAQSRGLISAVPDLPLYDPEAEPARYIPKEHILRLIRFAGHISAHEHRGGWAKESRYRCFRLKLLIFWMWKGGARPSEILSYRFEMLDWSKGSIRIPAPITKTRRAREIQVDAKVLRVLRFLRARSRSEWVFPSPVIPGERMKDYDSAWTTVNERLGFDYDIYNLRDTYITDQLEGGMNAVFIGKHVDNSAAMIERRYAAVIMRVMARLAGARGATR